MGDRITSFTLNDLQGSPQSVDRWKGQTLVINFWASWCPPCIREIPALDTLQSRYRKKNLTVLGIAYDTRENVQRFLTTIPRISFPILQGRNDVAQLMTQLGNKHSVLPFTVIVDKSGVITRVHAQGELDLAELESLISTAL